MGRYRFALQTVVAKEAKAYGYTVVIWSTGALLIDERGKPTAGAVLAFVGGVLLAQACGVLLAFGNPTRAWQQPSNREYIWTTFHAAPLVAAVLAAWGVAAGLDGAWAYVSAPFAATVVYELLLGLESLLLTAEDEPTPAATSASPDG